MKNEHIFNFQGNNVKLIVTNDNPPKNLPDNGEEIDILVHVKNDEEEINEDVLEKLDLATDLIKKKHYKNPESELETYKMRISKYDVYIRDEAKDNLILSTVLYVLEHISEGVDELISELYENEQNEEEQNESYNVKLPEQNNESKINISKVDINKSDDEGDKSGDDDDIVDMLLNNRQ